MARRTLRRLAAVLATLMAGAVLLVGGGLLYAWQAIPVDTVGEVSFDRELQIPAMADSTIDEQGRRVFSLTAQEGSVELGARAQTRTWGFDGAHLGPTLRATRGEQVAVRVHNELSEATTVHWHGMHLPAAMDGGPHQMVDPGQWWEPTWTVDQPAATLWYHPHPHGATADHVSRGLAGLFILDDPVEAALDLPRDYGVDDLPVIVQDVSLRGDGQLGAGRDRGEEVLVNGTPGPYAVISTELVRLRLVNASTMRVYEFGLDDDSSLAQIASDGGLLPAPHWTTRVMLSPGERAEILVAMEPGETRVLRSHPPDLGVGAVTSRFGGGADRMDVLQLRAATELAPSAPVPDVLVPGIADHAGLEQDVAATRSFELRGRSINGARMDMSRVDEVVTLGDTEVWEVVNTDGEPHNFHIHDVQFRVLSVGGRPPEPGLSGLKDTVYLPPGVPLRLLMTFRGHPDPETPYMYHCHLLRHEDQGMMGQFVVVEEASPAPGRVDTDGSDHDH